MHYDLSAVLEEALSPDSEAGLVIVQSEDYHARLVVTTYDGVKKVEMIRTLDGKEERLGSREIEGTRIQLTLQAEGQSVKAMAEVNGEEFVIAEDVDIRHLSTETAGGFVGCTLGLYTTSKEGKGHVDVQVLNLNNRN